MSERTSLGNIAELKTGPFGTQLHANEYVTDGIPVINVRNIGYGKIIDTDYDMVSKETLSRLSEHTLKENDIVFGRKGSIDRHAFIDKKYEGWMQGSDCIRVRIQDNDINSRYVSHYLKLDSVKRQLINGAVGSTMPSMNTDILKSIVVSLPKKEEQDAIEAVLSSIEQKIENNSAICSDLESMAKLLYDYWFLQFDFPDENGRPYKSSGGKMVWNEELKREIPEGWEVINISDIALLKQESVFPNKGVIYSHYSIPAFDESKMPSIEDGEEIESNKYVVPNDSILVSKLNPQFKRIWLILEPQKNAICSTEFLPITADGVGVFCLYEILNSDAYSVHLRQKASSSTGSRKRIDPENCMSYQLAFDKNIAELFDKKIESLLKKANRIPIENQQLASLRDFLLPMLMNGQVKVGKAGV